MTDQLSILPDAQAPDETSRRHPVIGTENGEPFPPSDRHRRLVDWLLDLRNQGATVQVDDLSRKLVDLGASFSPDRAIAWTWDQYYDACGWLQAIEDETFAAKRAAEVAASKNKKKLEEDRAGVPAMLGGDHATAYKAILDAAIAAGLDGEFVRSHWDVAERKFGGVVPAMCEVEKRVAEAIAVMGNQGVMKALGLKPEEDHPMLEAPKTEEETPGYTVREEWFVDPEVVANSEDGRGASERGVNITIENVSDAEVVAEETPNSDGGVDLNVTIGTPTAIVREGGTVVHTETGEVELPGQLMALGWTEYPTLSAEPTKAEIAEFERKVDQVAEIVAECRDRAARWKNQAAKRAGKQIERADHYEEFVAPMARSLAKFRIKRVLSGKNAGALRSKSFDLASARISFAETGGLDLSKSTVQAWVDCRTPDELETLPVQVVERTVVERVVDWPQLIEMWKAGLVECPGISETDVDPFGKVTVKPAPLAKVKGGEEEANG